MTEPGNKLFGLSPAAKEKLISRMRNRHGSSGKQQDVIAHSLSKSAAEIPAEYYDVEKLPGLRQLQIQKAAADKFGIENPFFRCHDGAAGSLTRIDGRECVNFSGYNYLGLSGHPRVSRAAKDAIDRFGTSVSASRPVSGERAIHRELEQKLAALYGTEDCIIFVSGHAANVTTLGCLFGKNDLILHDALIHNSVIQGAILSGAKRLSFQHNDWEAVDKILGQSRANYQRVVIVIEGLYSMEGDLPDLDRFIELKTKHRTFLMVDEAHSLGVLGTRGRGLGEHFGRSNDSIDILMGALSKTLAGCGGYIAGRQVLVDNLKFNAPGFVYSVGMAPAVAAASSTALDLMDAEPERVKRLQCLSRCFFKSVRDRGLDTGSCQGYAIVPVILGSSILAAQLSNRLLECGINVQPIIYPAVEERVARLRFFINSTHTEDQLHDAAETIAEELAKLKRKPVHKLFQSARGNI